MTSEPDNEKSRSIRRARGTRQNGGGPNHQNSPSARGEDDKTEALRQIGNRLRDLRQQWGFTLTQAASAANISPSFLGMLERGTTAVSVSRLIALADVYGVNVADLLTNVGEPESEFVRASEGYEAPTEQDDVRITYLSSASWSMQPFLVRLAPGAHLDSLSHVSEEFVHCVSGAPTMLVDETLEYPMSPGDTLFLRPGAKHAYLNDTRAVAVLVGAIRRAQSRTWGDELTEHRG